MGEFSRKAFVGATPIDHLNKVKEEVDEAIAKPDNVFEYADVLMAIFSATDAAGFTYNDLLYAAQHKFSVLQRRKWEKLDNGTWQHIK